MNWPRCHTTIPRWRRFGRIRRRSWRWRSNRAYRHGHFRLPPFEADSNTARFRNWMRKVALLRRRKIRWRHQERFHAVLDGQRAVGFRIGFDLHPFRIIAKGFEGSRASFGAFMDEDVDQRFACAML